MALVTNMRYESNQTDPKVVSFFFLKKMHSDFPSKEEVPPGRAARVWGGLEQEMASVGGKLWEGFEGGLQKSTELIKYFIKEKGNNNFDLEVLKS